MKNKLVVAIGLGMEFVGLVIVLVYAGRYMDRIYEWPGYGVTFGGLLALISWLVHVSFVVRGLDKEPEQPLKPPEQ